VYPQTLANHFFQYSDNIEFRYRQPHGVTRNHSTIWEENLMGSWTSAVLEWGPVPSGALFLVEEQLVLLLLLFHQLCLPW
jgi:hypothetical protein